jgi:pimeloyl-ACP methyl ester carboxylesterase
MLRSTGFNVMIYDYRGFGESSEFEIDNNMYIYPHFQDDMESMIDFCRRNYTATFDLYGWGIGAGLSLGIGWSRPEVKHIIADTPFLSMEDLEERFSSWDEPMEVPFAGYEKRFEPAYTLDLEPAANIKGVLIVVGSNDVLYSAEDYELLKQKQKKLVEIEVIDNPDRQDNYLVDKAAYASLLGDFLED